MEQKTINYPYLPAGRTILYVPESNKFMAMAKEYAKKYCTKLFQAGAAVVVKNGVVVGIGSIGNNPTHLEGCERIKQNMPTGQGYDLCPGCDPKFHSEPSAIRDTVSKGNDASGADLYLWGHFWCCKDCWDAMIAAGIKNVYVMEGSEVLFNKKDPNNIIGHQFDN
jgi:deoxycytidylate deaminase